MKAFIQLTNNRSCLLRADEIKADYERGHITVSDGGCIQGVFDMGVLEYVYMTEPRETRCALMCARCGHKITEKGCKKLDRNYCKKCGQAIDWSDDE